MIRQSYSSSATIYNVIFLSMLLASSAKVLTAKSVFTHCLDYCSQRHNLNEKAQCPNNKGKISKIFSVVKNKYYDWKCFG